MFVGTMVTGITGMQHKSIGLAVELAFLRSALTLENKFNDTSEVLSWIQKRNRDVHVRLNRICFNEMQNWFIDDSKAKLQHRSGSFFRLKESECTQTGVKWLLGTNPLLTSPKLAFLELLSRNSTGFCIF